MMYIEASIMYIMKGLRTLAVRHGIPTWGRDGHGVERGDLLARADDQDRRGGLVGAGFVFQRHCERLGHDAFGIGWSIIMALPCSSGLNMPAGMGAPCIGISHNSYALPGGAGVRLLAISIKRFCDGL